MPTRDGVLVIRHENEISGTTDVAARPEFAARRRTKTVDGKRLTGWFTEDFTWAELKTLRCRERMWRVRGANRAYDGASPVLSLKELLALIDEYEKESGRALRLVAEIKHAHYFQKLGYDLADMLATELRQAGWGDAGQRVIVECFELGILRRIRENGQDWQTIFLQHRFGIPADEKDDSKKSYAWYRSGQGLNLLAETVHGISASKGTILQLDSMGRAVKAGKLASRAHEKGLTVYTWTLRPENRFLNVRYQKGLRPSRWGRWQKEFQLIISSGVDGFFVDHPDLGVRTRADLGLHAPNLG